jgi:hypothetical protein
MNFDDGSNPWLQSDASMLVLNVGLASQLRALACLTFFLAALNVFVG